MNKKDKFIQEDNGLTHTLTKVEDFIIKHKVKEALCGYINTIKILYSYIMDGIEYKLKM